MTKYDKILIIVVLIASTIVICIKTLNIEENKDTYIRIEVNGKVYKEIELEEHIKKEETINTKFGYNKIYINGLKVRVVEADCHDQIDVKQGYISKPGESLICLPNRVSIEVKSKDNKNNVDYISQ